MQTSARKMRYSITIIVATAFIVSCASPHAIQIPTDSITAMQLKCQGWRIYGIADYKSYEGEPLLKNLYRGEDWDTFKRKILPGDEVRNVVCGYQSGVAIFRNGIFIDSFMPLLITL